MDPVCASGESRCEKGPTDPDRSTCAPDRLSFINTPCPGNHVCVPTTTGSTCVARLCSPGDRQCSNDYLQVLVCDTSGTSLEIIETCADDEACSKGICEKSTMPLGQTAVSYTHLRAHETVLDLVCRLLLEKKKNNTKTTQERAAILNDS